MNASSLNTTTPTTTSSSYGTSSCTYRFMSSSLASLPPERDYNVIIRQQPQLARVCSPFERDRRQPIDPPPILQLEWINCSSEATKNSPFYFCMANLLSVDNPSRLLSTQDFLCGSTVSSLYRLRDIDNTDAGFFIFGDLIVLRPGHYRLHFSLFEIVEGIVQNRKTILSDPFVVYRPKLFPGPIDSTFLSRTFSDQGVKIRIRKHNRMAHPKKRKADGLEVHQITPPSSSMPPQQQSILPESYSKAPRIMFPSPPRIMASPPPEPCKLPSLRAIIDGNVRNCERTLPPLIPRPL